MANVFKLKLGDLVVRYGKVLKVFNINQDTISFQPFFDFKSRNGLTFTLKLKNVYDGHIRKLASLTKIKKLNKSIIKKNTPKEDCPAYDSKTALNQNQFSKTLWTIKTLWLEKQEKSGILLGGKLSTFKQALIQATEEIAAVKNTTPELEKALIMDSLKSSQK